MGLRAYIHRHREFLTGVLLVAFVVRAWVPAGFMPSSVDPWSLEMCRAGFAASFSPAQVESLFDHDEGSSSSESQSSAQHCAFASSGATPLPYVAGLVAQQVSTSRLLLDRQVPIFAASLSRAHGARAPPSLA